MKQILSTACLLLISCTTSHIPKPAAISCPTYMAGYDQIPDSDSHCFLRIYVRLASHHHPRLLFNPLTGSVGHVFLSLQKANNQDSCVRYFGFYPKNGFPGIFSNKPVTGIFIDNRRSLSDAVFRWNITPQELKSLLRKIQSMADHGIYQTYSHNCVDFALEILNQFKISSSLEILTYRHPLLPRSCHTPEDLYTVLLSIAMTKRNGSNNCFYPFKE
jgi:hypothetical protein